MSSAIGSRSSSAARASAPTPRADISRDELLNLMAGGKELVDLEAEIARLGKGRGVEVQG